MSKNVGEYGVLFNFNANYALTAATSLMLSFTRPDGTTFSATGSQVTAPNVPYVTTDGNGTFNAGEYARYTVAQGDWTVSGQYSVRLTYIDTTPMLLRSEPVWFVVNP